jgi:hypothetical protein
VVVGAVDDGATGCRALAMVLGAAAPAPEHPAITAAPHTSAAARAALFMPSSCWFRRERVPGLRWLGTTGRPTPRPPGRVRQITGRLLALRSRVAPDRGPGRGRARARTG